MSHPIRHLEILHAAGWVAGNSGKSAHINPAWDHEEREAYQKAHKAGLRDWERVWEQP